MIYIAAFITIHLLLTTSTSTPNENNHRIKVSSQISPAQVEQVAQVAPPTESPTFWWETTTTNPTKSPTENRRKLASQTKKKPPTKSPTWWWENTNLPTKSPTQWWENTDLPTKAPWPKSPKSPCPKSPKSSKSSKSPIPCWENTNLPTKAPIAKSTSKEKQSNAGQAAKVNDKGVEGVGMGVDSAVDSDVNNMLTIVVIVFSFGLLAGICIYALISRFCVKRKRKREKAVEQQLAVLVEYCNSINKHQVISNMQPITPRETTLVESQNP